MIEVLPLVQVAVLVFLIGVSLGVSGLGGFLVPVLLVAILGLDPVSAVAHGLLSFVIPGLIGVWMYRRKDNRPSWSLGLLLCIGSVPGLIIGRWIMAVASPDTLQAIMAGIVLAAGAVLLAQAMIARRTPEGRAAPPTRVVVPTATSAGLVGGLATVLAGVGGPLITVPVLVALGLELTPVVGASLLNAVFAVLVGAVSMLGAVQLQPVVLAVIAVAQLLGVPVGAWLQGRVNNKILIILIAVGSLLCGCWLVVDNLWHVS